MIKIARDLIQHQ